ncbi:MAG: hypothetical protein H0X41_01015 [Chitinophagaceae bacterium]|nr:hypothetical protein [Chitinophagaceae bacterium]
MPLVYIKCPGTGFLVPTNHILPDEASMMEPADRKVSIECPYCNQIHVWNDTNGLFLSIADNNPSERFGTHQKF